MTSKDLEIQGYTKHLTDVLSSYYNGLRYERRKLHLIINAEMIQSGLGFNEPRTPVEVLKEFRLNQGCAGRR